MTNKEAKEKLYMEWQKFLEDNIDYAGVSEAYKMAFKALEQEPINYKTQYENYLKKSEVVISQLRADRDRLQDAFDKVRAEIEQLPTNTRINWDGCCPDIDYPEIEYVDVTKNKLLSIIDKYRAESEDNNG